jgi:VIT1/CCC1 family predicted Fe2+/Mn2+ transporter
LKNNYSHQLVMGITFGLTTSVITSLGLIAGIYSATSSKLSVVAAIAVMAVADGLSDAVSLHTVEEAELDDDGRPRHTHLEVWMTTVFTFMAVAIFSLSFIVPIIVLPLRTAVYAAVAWGVLLLGVLNYYVARARKENPLRPILEHIGIAALVIVASHFVGRLISSWLA